jgi:hypothetical protein
MNYPNDIPNNGDMNNFLDNKIYDMKEDRVNYMPNIDNYKVQFLNQMPSNNTSYGSNYNTNVTNKSSSFLEPYQGFIRGNLFANLYDGYKNYKPYNINSSSERESLLNQWQQYDFALTDLNLYLDLYPNDSNALKLYNNYLNIRKQIGDKYESMYGPLTVDGEFNKNNWVWINSPWPWEEM